MDQMSIGRLLRGLYSSSPQEVSIARGGGGRWGEGHGGPGRRGKGGVFEKGPGREPFERGGRVLGNEQSSRQEVGLVIVAFPIGHCNPCDNNNTPQTDVAPWCYIIGMGWDMIRWYLGIEHLMVLMLDDQGRQEVSFGLLPGGELSEEEEEDGEVSIQGDIMDMILMVMMVMAMLVMMVKMVCR